MGYKTQMPYLLLLAGLVFAIVGLYRFFLRANPRQVKALFQAMAAVGVAVAALFLTLTGKLPAAIVLLTALWPIGMSYLRNRRIGSDTVLPLNEKEAYDVLGLKDGASEEEIRAAHHGLMKKVHPDLQGTDWLAQKINAAKDLLLNQKA